MVTPKKTNNVKLKILLLVGLFVFVGLVASLVPAVSRAQLDLPAVWVKENGQAVSGTEIKAQLQADMWTILSTIMSSEAAGIEVLTKGLVTVASYQAYFNEDFVQTGWGAIRDLANLSFILVLMVIALMSIMRIEESVVRKLLPRFVFAVLTVNFSFFFCRLVISFADGLSQGFQPAIGGMGDAIFSYLQVFNITKTSANPVADLATAGPTAAFLGIFMMGLLMIALYFVVAALGIRIIALAILVILSPFAFLAMILPSTASLASKWMKNLFSYAMWGPASLFFLWLSVITYTSGRSPLSTSFDAMGSQPIPGIALTSGMVMKFIIVMIFMYLAVIAGKLLGNTGADLGMKFGKGSLKLAGKAAAGVGGAALGVAGFRGFGKGIAAAYKDFVKSQEEVGKARAKQLVGAGWNEPGKAGQALNPFSRKFNKKVAGKEAAERIKKHKQDAKELTKPQILSRWSEIQGDKGSDALEEKQALLELAAEKGWLTDNAMFGDVDPIGEPDGKGGMKNGLADKVKDLGFDNDDAQSMVARISSISQSSDSGDKRFVGINDYDAELKRVKVNSEEKYADEVAKGMAKIANKGSVESKKVGARTFKIEADGDKIRRDKNGKPTSTSYKSAVYAASGIDDQVDSFSGNPVKMKAMLQKESLEALAAHPKELVQAVQAHIDANKGMADDQHTTIKVGSEELKMTMGRAKQYVKVVDKARKEVDEPEPSETPKTGGGTTPSPEQPRENFRPQYDPGEDQFVENNSSE